MINSKSAIISPSAIPAESGPRLTPRQLKNLDELLCIGGSRPEFSPDFIDELLNYTETQVRQAMKGWTSNNLSITKTNYLNIFKCEGLNISSKSSVLTEYNKYAFIGSVSHLAIQLYYTHKNRNIDELVRDCIVGIRKRDEKADAWYASIEKSEQSEVIASVTSKVINFLDDWPPLNNNWSPRFEEPISIKIGGVSISSRADLILGRPRTDNKQTMFIVDLKSSILKEEHYEEASFYALLATLRFKVMPWRSIIYSLTSGEYSEPDITESRLLQTSTNLVKSIESYIEVLSEKREPILTINDSCKFCNLKNTCTEYNKAGV